MSSLRELTPRQRLIGVLFLVPILLLLVLSPLSLVTGHKVRTAARHAIHALEVRDTVGCLTLHLLEAETVRRELLLGDGGHTPDSLQLALRKLEGDLVRLDDVMSQDPVELDDLQRLRTSVISMMQWITRNSPPPGEGSPPGAEERADKPDGHSLMQEILRSRATIGARQSSRIVASQEQAASMASITDKTSLAVVLVVLVVLWLLARLFMRHCRLRMLAVVCAWSKTIWHDGRWVSFEDYIEQRFRVRITHGISPQAFDAVVAREMDACAEGQAGQKDTTRCTTGETG